MMPVKSVACTGSMTQWYPMRWLSNLIGITRNTASFPNPVAW
jgi:hypothetical protein